MGAAMDEQPQAFASLQFHFPMEPPHRFTHSAQHFVGLYHPFPAQPKPALFWQTSVACESSLPRFGSSATGVASDQRDSCMPSNTGKGGWGETPAAKTTGSHCVGQATPAATPEVTPEAASSNLLLRRSTLHAAPTRATIVRRLMACSPTCGVKSHTNRFSSGKPGLSQWHRRLLLGWGRALWECGA